MTTTTTTMTAPVVRCCCVGTATTVPTRGIAVTRRGYNVAGARLFGQYSAIRSDNASHPPRCPPPLHDRRVCRPRDCERRAAVPLTGCSPAREYCWRSLASDRALRRCRRCGLWRSSLRCRCHPRCCRHHHHHRCHHRRRRRRRRHRRRRTNWRPTTGTHWTGLLSFLIVASHPVVIIVLLLSCRRRLVVIILPSTSRHSSSAAVASHAFHPPIPPPPPLLLLLLFIVASPADGSWLEGRRKGGSRTEGAKHCHRRVQFFGFFIVLTPTAKGRH
jgi:hypothetical protein